VNDYKNLSITANIKIDEPKEGETLLTLGDWGSDYTINGNGHVITYPTGANGNLTGVNKGIINNLGVVNGNIAATNGGTLKIAFETTDGKTYNIYTAEGKQEASLSMDSTLVGRARPYFGVLIDENGNFGKLDKKTAANTVYKAEWTNAESKEKTTFYTNATYEDTEVIGLSYNPAKAMANTFTYVLETENLTITEQFTEKNVVVKGICNNAKFTDNVAEGGRIYIPKKFTAKELTYDRSFKSSALATVCLPFAVSAKTLEENGVVKKMQFSYVETATNTYWFQHLGDDEAMKANEPYVLKFEDGFGGGEIFADLTNIEVAATGSSINSLAVAPSNPGNGAEFLGVFESTNASKLMRGGYTLYGFINGKFSPMDAPDPASVKMLPFRTYVRTRNENNAPAAPFILGELDEDGNIISDGDETGVNTAVKEADAFSVKGINGALVITTNKTQKVNVYTIGGSLVKATNVEAGSVTIPVAAGMYIVNGKKVFVK
ncbi:MAG: hypothetical protein K2O17_06280, partial [Bacteroidaceae bacterium]|nr:hypothetical protein [Bacteroidaceae bacterium]